MARIPIPAVADLTPEQRRVYDDMAALRNGHVPKHYHSALCNPELADKWQQIGELLRYRTSLPLRLSELAILVTARYHRCDYEWIAHRPVALKAGLAADHIEAIRLGERPAFADADEQAIYDYCAILFERKFVDDAVYQRALAAIGECGIVELTALLGYYAMVALAINGHQLPLQPGAEPVFSR